MEPSVLMLQASSSYQLPQMLLLFLVFGAIFYFILFRPEKQRRKKLGEFIAALKNGDKVVTHAGIYGVIAGVKEKTFILKISDQVKIEVSKNSISGPQSTEENQQS